MIGLRRILFATDFSEESQPAQELACAFADQFRAELHLLHVVQETVLFTVAPDGMFEMPMCDVDDLRESAQKALESLLPAARPVSNVVCAARAGAPFVEIIGYAREQQIDLIVLGTHGRSGLEHVLLGSVAENVVRKACCPVMTVRPSSRRLTAACVKRDATVETSWPHTPVTICRHPGPRPPTP